MAAFSSSGKELIRASASVKIIWTAAVVICATLPEKLFTKVVITLVATGVNCGSMAVIPFTRLVMIWPAVSAICGKLFINSFARFTTISVNFEKPVDTSIVPENMPLKMVKASLQIGRSLAPMLVARFSMLSWAILSWFA